MRPAAVKLTLVVLSSGLLACARGVATPVGGADESSAPDDRPAFADGGPVADLAGGPAPDSTGILSPDGPWAVDSTVNSAAPNSAPDPGAAFGCPYGPPWYKKSGPVPMEDCEPCLLAARAACKAMGGSYRMISGYHPQGRDWGWGPSLACSGASGPYAGPTTTLAQTTWLCADWASQQSLVIATSDGTPLYVFVSP